MNKAQIIESLSNISNQLDNNTLYKEANILTNVMKKLAQEETNTFNLRSNQDENYPDLIMQHLFEDKLWPMIPRQFEREDHPIHKFSGSDKIRWVLKQMRDLLSKVQIDEEYVEPKQLRNIVNVYRDFLKDFINSEFIGRAENKNRNERLDSFLTLLDQAEKAINQGNAEEFWESLP